MTNTVIITGGLGFIGRNVAKLFNDKNYFVIGIGHGKATQEELAKIGIDEWHQADISLDALKKITKKANVLIHCAGGSTVGISLSDPRLDYHKTVNSTLEVIEFIRTCCPDTSLIYLSSAAVYGSKADNLIYEDESSNPVSPYGFHKLASESICKSYATCFGIKVAIIRLFSIYGEGLMKQLLWEASNKIVKANNRVVFYGSGEETRDWLHITDAAKLIYHLANMDFQYLVLNGAYGERVSVKHILERLLNEFNRNDVELIFNNEHKEGDPKYYNASMDKVLATGWKPEIGLSGGLSDYAKWFKKYI